MKYLCIGEKYQKDGEEKIAFKRVGELFDGKNGKTYAKIYHIPNTLIHVFEADQKKEDAQSDEPAF